jgi:hypothetical protein
MGLDAVELVMAYEEAFGIEIPDREASEMRTPRDVIEFVQARLPVLATADCMRQRAFYLLRRKAVEVLGVKRKDFQPDTLLTALLPRERRAEEWDAFRAAVGAKCWPALQKTFIRVWAWPGPPAGHETIRDLAEFIVAQEPQLLTNDVAWTRERIACVVRDLTLAYVSPDCYREDGAYVRDMGLS